MGIDSDRFVYAVPQGSYCILCNLVLEEPIEIIACGHYVCHVCWDTWLENNKNTSNCSDLFIACPYCGLDIDSHNTRQSKITWSLIQNMNVYCAKKSEGCERIYKLGFDDLHREKCLYQNKMEILEEAPLKCDTCSLTIDANNRSHSCVKELLQTLKKQSTEITNLEHENNRLIFKLSTCEKEFMEEQAEQEGQYFQESLKYGKEIRDLRTRLASLQGEMSRKKGQSDVELLTIDLYRVNGSLGFNIIGGATKDDNLASSIYVSRIVEGGAADRPGKLQLHDCILEVDGVDLRNASHDIAVQTFKNSGDPVKMVIQRNLNKTKACDATTQTFSGGVVFAVTGEEDEIKKINEPVRNLKKNNSRWLNPHEIADSVNFSGSDDGTDIIHNNVENKDESRSEYDSAYDTLLTQKSSRSTARSGSVNEQSDSSYTTLKSGHTSDTHVVYRNKASSDDCDIKRQSTFLVIPNSDEPKNVEVNTWEDLHSATECEAEFEFEYEEVCLRKEGGKLGMVLCYGGNETDVAVYVGDLEENSVADNSGKIMVGDQIVQINGTQIDNVEEAHKLLQESNDITLVVARAVYEQQTDYYDEAEETDLDMLDCINEETESVFSGKSSPTYVSSNSSKHSSPKPERKDFGDNSTPTSPKSEPEIIRSRAMTLSPVHDSPVEFQLPERRGRSTSVNDSSSLDEKGKRNSSADSIDRKREDKNENKESIKSSLKNFMKNNFGNSEKKTRAGSHSDDSCELNKIPRCDSNGSNSSSRSNKSSGKENTPHGQLKAKLKEQKNLSKMKAYLDSPSLQRHRVNNNMVVNQNHNMVVNQNHQMPPMMSSQPQFLYPGQMINVPVFTQMNPVGMMQPGGMHQFQPVLMHHNPAMTMKNGVSYNMNTQKHPLGSMTGSVSSLRSAMKNSTMPSKNFNNNNNHNNKQRPTAKKVHIDPHQGWNETERRVWEEFKIIQSMESKENEKKNEKNTEIKVDPSKVEAEWRVRRSKDGKHVYIKKTNSSRTKILKERAQQINDERCGITTDDDAFTVYQGQYWNRDQRKKQLNRHNDRRKRLVEKAAVKAAYEHKTEKAMAEIVQRKMMPGTVFDNFITVEEILSQRNRSGIFDGPIHVTTI